MTSYDQNFFFLMYYMGKLEKLGKRPTFSFNVRKELGF